jgi:hypothetical protein
VDGYDIFYGAGQGVVIWKGDEGVMYITFFVRYDMKGNRSLHAPGVQRAQP